MFVLACFGEWFAQRKEIQTRQERITEFHWERWSNIDAQNIREQLDYRYMDIDRQKFLLPARGQDPVTNCS